MECSQDIIDAYTHGYKDGWRSVSGSGQPPPVLGFVNAQFLIEGKSVYEAGYERGRAAAAER
jgi:hypothetical protein